MVFTGIVEEMGTVVSLVELSDMVLWDGSRGAGWCLPSHVTLARRACTSVCRLPSTGPA